MEMQAVVTEVMVGAVGLWGLKRLALGTGEGT